MLRKLNRVVQDYLRPKRLAIGRWMWDRKEKVENNGYKSILFLRYDGKIGDMVINTPMFREIKKQYPDIKIGVVARDGAKAIIENNKYVDKIYDYKKGTANIKELAKEIADEKYDLLIDFTEMLRVQQMMFINLCKAKHNMGFDKKGWNLFDLTFEKDETPKHITNIYRKVLEILKVENIDMSYDLEVSIDVKEEVKKILDGIGEFPMKIVFNPFAASKHRSLNKENIDKVVEKLIKETDSAIFILATKENLSLVEPIRDKYRDRVFVPKLSGIMAVSELIKGSDLVISPDTSIVHIAVAHDKPIIAFYREDVGIDKNLIVWGPNSDKAKIIYAKGNHNIGEEIDINSFDFKDFKI